MSTFERLDTEHLDYVDAALFSGDMFSDANNRKLLKEYLDRWENKLILIEFETTE